MVKAAMCETKGTDKNINELRVCIPVRRHTEPRDPAAVSSRDLAKVCLMIAEAGHKDMELRITSPDDVQNFV